MNSPAEDCQGVELHWLRRDGLQADVELMTRAFHYEGKAALQIVARDITRQKNAERHVLAISERERQTLGREMHDSLCQSLLGVAFMADTLRKQVVTTNPKSDAQAAEITRIARQCCEDARNLARGLYPAAIESSGLIDALRGLVADVTSRTRIVCELECDDHLSICDPSVATNLFRIAQEAITNAIQHGRAKSVLVQLIANSGELTLRVRDDGRGILAKPKRAGLGLHIMQYRANAIGGVLDIRRERPRGTVVMCSFPTAGKSIK